MSRAHHQGPAHTDRGIGSQSHCDVEQLRIKPEMPHKLKYSLDVSTFLQGRSWRGSRHYWRKQSSTARLVGNIGQKAKKAENNVHQVGEGKKSWYHENSSYVITNIPNPFHLSHGSGPHPGLNDNGAIHFHIIFSQFQILHDPGHMPRRVVQVSQLLLWDKQSNKGVHFKGSDNALDDL